MDEACVLKSVSGKHKQSQHGSTPEDCPGKARQFGDGKGQQKQSGQSKTQSQKKNRRAGVQPLLGDDKCRSPQKGYHKKDKFGFADLLHGRQATAEW